MSVIQPNVTDCALAFEGGGYRGSFSAGIASVLLDAHVSFGYVCGVSAGSSNTVNYVSQDVARTRGAFMTDGPARQMVGMRSLVRGHGYFDADGLYEGAVQTGALPFDWDAFTTNAADVRVQAFQRDTGRTLRFGKAGMTDVVRLMDVVRASSTLPGMMHPRPIDGFVLYDGGLGEGAGLPLRMAEQDGYYKTLLVATRRRGYRKKPPTRTEVRVYERISGEHEHLLRALLTRWERYNDELERIEGLERDGSVLVVRPEELLVSSASTNPRLLARQYELARAQAVRDLPRWREFLFGTSDGGPEAPRLLGGYYTIGEA